jgi:hypothetical protein
MDEMFPSYQELQIYFSGFELIVLIDGKSPLKQRSGLTRYKSAI